jgi:hypothetical protein
MADGAGPLDYVTEGDGLSATLENQIIDSVNRVRATPLTGSAPWKGKFFNGPQGIIVPAALDDAAGANDKYVVGDVVIITAYIPGDTDNSLENGAEKNLGVTVTTKSDTDLVGRSIAVVTKDVDSDGTGRVCISGACLATVNRVSTSPTIGATPAQLTGTLLANSVLFEIGEGVGDVDILWEENTNIGAHFAYVNLSAGCNKGIASVNSSGVEIPPYSAMEVTGEDAQGRLQMSKPSADNLSQIYYSPAFPIASGDPFPAIPTSIGKVEVTGSPAIGDEVGTVSGAWGLAKDNTGFTVTGLTGARAYASSTGGGGGLPLVYKAVTDESGGTVNVQAVNIDGTTTGEILTFDVLP